MKEKTFTESEIREVLAMMTTPCEDEIAMSRKISCGRDSDVSDTFPVTLAEAGAKALAEALFSGQKDPHELRWSLVRKSASRALTHMLMRCYGITPPQR